MNEIEIDDRKKELLELEQQTNKERQKLIAMIMEREEHLEKRERNIIERERELRIREQKLDEYKEKIQDMVKRIKEGAQKSKAEKAKKR